MKSKTKKKSISWQKIIGTACMVLMGIALGYVLGYTTVDIIDMAAVGETVTGSGLIRTWIFVPVVLCVSIVFQTILHEAGHLVFGLLSGYKFSSFRIFSLMWVKENEKIALKRYSLAGTVGQCLMSPPDMVNGKIPFVLFNLGGVIVNIVSGIVFLLLHFVLKGFGYVSAVMLVFSFAGFVMALMNGLPMNTGTVSNDGYNTVSIKGNKAAMRSFWIQMKITEQLSKGIRIKDMPAQWFTVPSDEDMKNGMASVMGVFACNRLIDELRFTEAEKLMAHILEIDSGIIALHRNLLLCDRAYVEMIGENRNEVLNGILTKDVWKLIRNMKKFPTVLRTEYVYSLLVLKDSKKAEKIKRNFEKIALKYPYPQDIEAERELMAVSEQKSV